MTRQPSGPLHLQGAEPMRATCDGCGQYTDVDDLSEIRYEHEGANRGLWLCGTCDSDPDATAIMAANRQEGMTMDLELHVVREGRWVVRSGGALVYGGNGTLRTMCEAFIEGATWADSDRGVTMPEALAALGVANVLCDRYGLKARAYGGSVRVQGDDKLTLVAHDGRWWLDWPDGARIDLAYRGSKRQLATDEGPAVVAEAYMAHHALLRLGGRLPERR